MLCFLEPLSGLFFLKDLIVNIVSPVGRQFCWMSREDLGGRLTSFRHVV